MNFFKSLPYVLVTVIFSLSGQALLKTGITKALDGRHPTYMDFIRQHLMDICLSPWALSGIFLSIIGLISYMYMLAFYDVSRLLPIMGAMAYIGMFFVGHIWLNEQTSWVNFAGIILIVGGLYLVTLKAA